MSGYYVLKNNVAGQYHFTVKAKNHEVVLSSNQFAEKAEAQKAIETVRDSAAKDLFDRKTSKAGEPYFTVKSDEGHVVGTSEMYSSKAAMENGIQALKNAVPGAAIEDVSDPLY